MTQNIKSLIREKVEGRRRFFSIEVTPRPEVIIDLKSEFKDQQAPLFVSVTWIGDDNLKYASIEQSPAIKTGLALAKSTPVLLHLSCFNLSLNHLDDVLGNFTNIFPLRGDRINEKQEFKTSSDLVKAIRSQKGETPTIASSGYPPNSRQILSCPKYLAGAQVLREKVDAGVDVIITQVVYDADCFVAFVEKCRDMGIDKPIIPGIFVPASFANLERMQEITHTQVPLELWTRYEKLQENEPLFQKLAVRNTIELLTKLFTDERVIGVHFFTMNNLELIKQVVRNFNFA